MKKWFIPLFLTLSVFILSYNNSVLAINDNTIAGATTAWACPADAKMCADGSYVVRTGPNCDFAPCLGDDPYPYICPDDAKVCSDGSYVTRTGPNCDFAPCPITNCTTDYAPVCATPKVMDCPEGMGCPAMIPQPQTYRNLCLAQDAGASFLYEGECQTPGPQVCTMEYAPVCAQPKIVECGRGVGMECPDYMPPPQTYSNLCMAESVGATFLYEGVCQAPNPQVCTMEYAPVCGEVQVQCFTTPCLPIKQTFSNICELNNNPLATFLYNGECDDTDPYVCSTEYAPVCGNDGNTYRNSCLARDVGVQYIGKCIADNTQLKLEIMWNSLISIYLEDLTEGKQAKFLTKFYELATSYAYNDNYTERKRQLYHYIAYLALKDLHELYESYIERNIENISPIDTVLGGSWYVTRIEWIDTHMAQVEYEDGHIAQSIYVEMSTHNGILRADVVNRWQED